MVVPFSLYGCIGMQTGVFSRHEDSRRAYGFSLLSYDARHPRRRRSCPTGCLDFGSKGTIILSEPIFTATGGLKIFLSKIKASLRQANIKFLTFWMSGQRLFSQNNVFFKTIVFQKSRM